MQTTDGSGIWQYVAIAVVAFLLGGGLSSMTDLLRMRRKHREDGRHD